MPDLLPLSSEYLRNDGAYLLDCGWSMYLLIGRMCHHEFIKQVLDESQFSDIKEPMYSIPELENEQSKGFMAFIEHLQSTRPHHAPIRVLRLVRLFILWNKEASTPNFRFIFAIVLLKKIQD